ncbi:MAG: DUF1648 domain-containing protein [Cyclobacteriaceae bacterium]
MRPKLKIPLTTTDWVFEIVALLGIILTIGYFFLFYSNLPDIIPSHYNLSGQPNAVGKKSLLIVLVSIAIVIYLIMTIAARFPYIFNFPFEITVDNAETQYKNAVRFMRVLKTLVTLVFFYIIFTSIQNGLGKMQGIESWFIPVVLLSMLVVVGSFIYRAFRLR